MLAVNRAFVILVASVIGTSFVSFRSTHEGTFDNCDTANTRIMGNYKSVVDPKTHKMERIIKEIEDEVEHIRVICGDICDTETAIRYPTRHRNLNCKHIFTHDMELDKSHHPNLEKPLKVYQLTAKLREYFSLHGRAELTSRYINEQKHKVDDNIDDSDVLDWTTQLPIDKLVEKAKDLASKGIVKGYYKDRDRKQLYKAMQMMDVKGKRILVIGSMQPWVEILLLTLGASSVHTLEYAKIKSNYSKMKTFTPIEFRNEFLSKQLELYDAVVSFSSIEHSGLGRYGDGINPWGDLITMAKVWCVLKPKGKVIMGFPIKTTDTVSFNAMRIYGPIRIPLLFEHFNILWTSYDNIRHINKSNVANQGVVLAEKS